LQSQNKEEKSLLDYNNIQSLHFEKETKGWLMFLKKPHALDPKKESLSVTSRQVHLKTPSATLSTPPPYSLMK
jgi:hypothetical protein